MEQNDNRPPDERQRDRRRGLVDAAQSLLRMVGADPELPMPSIDLGSTLDQARFYVDRLTETVNLTPAELVARLSALLTDVEHKIDLRGKLFDYRLTGWFGPLKVTVLSNLGVTPEMVDAARAELGAGDGDNQSDFCEAPVQVTMAVTHGIDVVFLWSCLQHADEWATTLESEFGMAPERAARLTPTAKCGNQGNQSMVSVAVDSVEYAIEVDMDAVHAFNRGGES